MTRLGRAGNEVAAALTLEPGLSLLSRGAPGNASGHARTLRRRRRMEAGKEGGRGKSDKKGIRKGL